MTRAGMKVHQPHAMTDAETGNNEGERVFRLVKPLHKGTDRDQRARQDTRRPVSGLRTISMTPIEPYEINLSLSKPMNKNRECRRE